MLFGINCLHPDWPTKTSDDKSIKFTIWLPATEKSKVNLMYLPDSSNVVHNFLDLKSA